MARPRDGAGRAAVVLGLAVWAGAAGTAAATPAPKDICHDGRVDKHRLMSALADASHLSWSFGEALSQTASPGAQPAWRRLAAGKDLCKQGVACTKADKAALEAIEIQLIYVLTQDATEFRPTKRVTSPEAFIADEDAQLECVAAAPATPVQTAAAPPPAAPAAPSTNGFQLDRFRIRGVAQDLFYPRTAPQFKGLSKTSLSFTSDQIADKETQKFVGVLGYSLRPDYLLNSIIPYVGINRSVSKTKGKAESVSADTRDYGVLGTFYVRKTFGTPEHPLVLGNYLTLSPDYLFDFTDHSAIVSANLTYIPYLNARLNDYIAVRSSDGPAKLFSWEPIAELHWDNGWYVQAGVANQALHRDYSRLGGRFGVSVISENPDIPLTLTVTDIQLGGLSGPVGHISYLSSALSWSLSKFVSLDLSYVDGRREDTAKRERTTAVSLSAKY